MNAQRRPPTPPSRSTADGVASALRHALPADDNGLGAVGEEAFNNLIDQADRDEANHRTLMKFPPWWRTLIRSVDEEDAVAIREIIDAHKQRKAVRAFWVRTWIWAAPIGAGALAWGSGFLEKWGPWIKRILKAVAESPPA